MGGWLGGWVAGLSGNIDHLNPIEVEIEVGLGLSLATVLLRSENVKHTAQFILSLMDQRRLYNTMY